ncbi:hypothetical protein B1R94_06640 [Mycolicibacterium litorale]|nr:hypothetical protein B1R94_06640 [Mycolicibacterium litorale]
MTVVGSIGCVGTEPPNQSSSWRRIIIGTADKVGADVAGAPGRPKNAATLPRALSTVVAEAAGTSAARALPAAGWAAGSLEAVSAAAAAVTEDLTRAPRTSDTAARTGLRLATATPPETTLPPVGALPRCVDAADDRCALVAGPAGLAEDFTAESAPSSAAAIAGAADSARPTPAATTPTCSHRTTGRVFCCPLR